MSSVSPTSSPAPGKAPDEPCPLPFIASTAGSAAAPPASAGPSSSSHWDGQAPSAYPSGPSSSGVYSSQHPHDQQPALVRFLPIAQPGNGPQEALDRMRELARQTERRPTNDPTAGVVVSSAKYTTSADVRGYIPVLEFPLGEQVLMIDSENGLVHWTSIWKLLGNSKADMVRLVEMQPEVGTLLKKVRGGYLKIQGTWLPYDIALNLSRRVAYPIRHDLVPLFGADFPASCIVPSQPGFGQITLAAPGTSTRRGRQKRAVPGPAEARRAPSSPRGPAAAHPPPTAHYRHGNDRTMISSGPVRYNGPMEGSARYSPYGGYSAPLPAQQPVQAGLFPFPSHHQPPPPPAQMQMPPSATTMYPETSARYYPPPPPTAAAEHPTALGAYRFPPLQAAPQPYPPHSSNLRSPGRATSFAERRPSLQIATGQAPSAFSITQLLDGDTPPDTPFSLPLPLVGAKFASPISGDQHQLSVLDGAAVPRRGSQQFKRLLGDRDDWTPPATGSSGPQMGYFRRDSLPSPLRTTLPGLSLSDRRGPSPPSSGIHVLSARSANHRLPLVEAERDDDGLSAHSSGVSSPRTAGGSPDPVVIRTHSRDDTDDRSRQGSFTSTLGVYLGPSDGVGRSWPAGKPVLDSSARFPSILSTAGAGPPSFPTSSSYAPVSRVDDARRHSASEQLQASTSARPQLDAFSSERSSFASQSSLPASIPRSPLRPW